MYVNERWPNWTAKVGNVDQAAQSEPIFFMSDPY